HYTIGFGARVSSRVSLVDGGGNPVKLLPGDELLTINGTDVSNTEYENILGIIRNQQEKILHIQVHRTIQGLTKLSPEIEELENNFSFATAKQVFNYIRNGANRKETERRLEEIKLKY